MKTKTVTSKKSALNKPDVLSRFSEGLIWIINDANEDAIQAWDEDEEVVRAHCKKHNWTYYGLPAFRKIA